MCMSNSLQVHLLQWGCVLFRSSLPTAYFIEDSSSGLIILKVINNIHLTEFFYFFPSFRTSLRRMCSGGENYKKWWQICKVRSHLPNEYIPILKDNNWSLHTYISTNIISNYFCCMYQYIFLLMLYEPIYLFINVIIQVFFMIKLYILIFLKLL